MRLGTDTGSMVNHIYSRAVKGQPEPEIGMGATVLHWTDREAATVVAIDPTKKGLVVSVQEDTARRIDKNGLSEMQEYEYTPNAHGFVQYFRRREDGTWQEVEPGSRPMTFRKIDGGGNGLRLGERRKYHDFSF